MSTLRDRAIFCACVLAIGLFAIAGSDNEPLVLAPEQSGAGSSMYAQPNLALLTDAQCLGYSDENYHLVVAYINLQSSPRAVDYVYSGVGSSVNDTTHDVGQGFRLVPLRKDGQAGRVLIRVRQTDSDPISDDPKMAMYDKIVSELPQVTANSLGARCGETKKRRVTR